MEQFFTTYFDFNLMGEYFGDVLEGFWWTIRLSIVGGILALIWGLILAVLRQLPGRALAPVRWVTIAYIDALRGIPMLLTLLLIYGGLGTLQAEGTIPKW
ncbi:MAG: ABC transporter permease subunit, partial [Solirubrobacterales bacterium]